MKKIYALCLSLLALLLVSSATLQHQSYATDGCSALYNGGVTSQQFCPTPHPIRSNLSTGKPSATPEPNAARIVPTAIPRRTAPQQTSGGQKIYPSPNTKTTPSTGPEEWAFPSLFFLAGFGFLLRNKAKT